MLDIEETLAFSAVNKISLLTNIKDDDLRYAKNKKPIPKQKWLFNF